MAALELKARHVKIENATEHNLKNVSLEFPLHKFVVVTGVSGSGKSSLAFDVIAREGQRRYLETFSSFSRQFMGKMARPLVNSIEGLAPVITVGQKTVGSNIRSTVGTMSDLYDHLRLLFARLGTGPEKASINSLASINRSLFSFNTPAGACPQCSGLGVEEKISLGKLVADPAKTLREGALAPTLPNGYIMYSQVTVDVLNQVCNAHGFSVDIPWKNLTKQQREIILNGSDRLKVPFGKHSLESRLKWTGIAAKPREEGFYKGMLPIMSDILRRDRNKNILRYAASATCSTCAGKRLGELALSVKLNDKSIDELAGLDLTRLRKWLLAQQWSAATAPLAKPVISTMCEHIQLLDKLGVGHLSLDRSAPSLSAGESQRIRLVNQVTARLSDVLYVFDEPSIGLHARDNHQLLEVLQLLVTHGNTVMVIEHDEATIRQADWIIDIGPKAGLYGGELLFNGPVADFLKQSSLAGKSPTYDWLTRTVPVTGKPAKTSQTSFISLQACVANNLSGFEARFLRGGLNAVTGVSGAGKSSLVHVTLRKRVEAHLEGREIPSASGLDNVDKLIVVNQSPIGRTPRSNPATYTGLADRIRDLFAKTDAAKTAGLAKGHFSFNNKAGRCETCEGAGQRQIGMHFLGHVSVRCPTCNGKRFNERTLNVRYEGKTIADVFEMSVQAATEFFSDRPTLVRPLSTLQRLGLGYLQLGQPSTTLSGGEAQRIKLATELQHTGTGKTLYILDEPTVGLHHADVEVLLRALRELTQAGNTVIVIEHDTHLIEAADWVLDLGPGSGAKGGRLVVQGVPREVAQAVDSVTGQVLFRPAENKTDNIERLAPAAEIRLQGVSTHQLKNVNITLPKNKLTVITGVSGSGKSSLAFDTIFAEAQSRFSESLSTYARSLLQQANPARMESSFGLGPVVAIGRKLLNHSRRSTVGTVSGIYDHYRLLYSRLAQENGLNYSTSHFSFNHQLGACPTCDGLGVERTCDPQKLVSHPERSVLDGAIQANKTARFYSDPNGQFLAILRHVAQLRNLNLHRPWNDLAPETMELVLYGTGEEVYDVTWAFQNKTRSGEQQVTAPWRGFCHYVNDEYRRKLHNKNIATIEALLHDPSCSACAGTRLRPEALAVKFQGISIAELCNKAVRESLALFQSTGESVSPIEGKIREEIESSVVGQMLVIQQLGLGHLNLSRSANSLSGGEGQRLRLAGQLAAPLYGVTYILDEPTIGLHDQDTRPLIAMLKRIIAGGNTVVVVEHDETVIRAADYLIEMGPGGGTAGGKIIARGTLDEVMVSPASVTAPYLRENRTGRPVVRSMKQGSFGVLGALKNNLRHLDISFNKGAVIAITGVSGSGKTTLVRDVLLASAKAREPIGCREFFGLDCFDRVLAVDQQPMSSNALSTPATYTGLMDVLRNLYFQAYQKDGSKNGDMVLKRSHFSHQHKDGKCPTCGGFGQIRTSMDFMSDVWTPCHICDGLRFRPEVLETTYHNQSIGQVLQMTVSEAIKFLAEVPKAHHTLQIMQDVGIGHLQLGQAGNTLSGGEAQRLKLAKELISSPSGENLYLFDEPSTGLHFADIDRMINIFNSLADQGHTVLFIEHHPQLIAIANQVLELGPGGGPEGGRIVRETS